MRVVSFVLTSSHPNMESAGFAGTIFECAREDAPKSLQGLLRSILFMIHVNLGLKLRLPSSLKA